MNSNDKPLYLPILKQGTWGIGFIGLAETLVALTGKHHGEDEESRELGLRIIKFLRKKEGLTQEELAEKIADTLLKGEFIVEY